MSPRAVLVDTNIASYLFHASARGLDYQALLANSPIWLSFVTVGEMQFGAEVARWGSVRRHALSRFIEQYRIRGYEKGMEMKYARIAAQCRWAGRALDWRDAWICTQAIWFEMPLVTHDGDFEGIPGLELITLLNPQVHDVCWNDAPTYGVGSRSSPEPVLSH